ncbi:MAG: hypothetical protein SO401_08990 [Blautia sp.]|nr:hypothetical protein [Blautia sp.]
MQKLMKYEFRKTMFSKVILLVITAISELAYLAGIFLKWENGLMIGIVGLALCGIIGIFYIGVESLIIFQKDLNTKQSYMLFLVPRNSYQILGAKVLENGISIFITGAFFAALAALDFTVGILYIGGLKEFIDVVTRAFSYLSVQIQVDPVHMVLVLFSMLTSWLMMIVIGNLAIVLSATVFSGKKFSGFISFLLFLVISWISGKGLDLISQLASGRVSDVLVIAGGLVILACMYLLTGWIMEKKLSV